MPFTLQQYAVKLLVMFFTIGIGLWCGWHDSYNAFYIASLIQAINNMYDSFYFLKGYNRFITTFEFVVFIGALITAVLSIIHFAPGGNCLDTDVFLVLITVFLSAPVLHFIIEVYLMIRYDLY